MTYNSYQYVLGLQVWQIDKIMLGRIIMLGGIVKLGGIIDLLDPFTL